MTNLPAMANDFALQQMGKEYLRAYASQEKVSALAITVHVADLNRTYSTSLTRSDSKIFLGNRNYLFQTGSITKSFIAALILKLEANPDYHFSLNDPIGKFFPHYKNWRNITIKQLLQMTSGIPDYANNSINLSQYSKQPFQIYRAQSWIQRVSRQPLLFKPGSKFHYSNTNYVLLGLIIEKITGHSLEYELREKIIEPLELNYTYYVIPLHRPVVHGYQAQNYLLPYIPLGKDITNYNVSYLNAAGGMFGTTDDINKWIRNLFTPDKVLSRPQLKKLTQFISEKNITSKGILTAQDRYAYGLGVSAEYDSKLKTIFYVYEGVTFGYRFLYLYSPTEKITITIAANSNSIEHANHLLDLAKTIYVKSKSSAL